MRCVLCDRRKARRHCPAKGNSICTQCCGEKRVLEIPCPEICEYLQIGRKHEEEEYGRLLRIANANHPERNGRVIQSYYEVAAHLEYTLAKERLSSRQLTDQDAVQALDLLIETYKTEENGILFEKTSDNLRIDALRRELRTVIESYRNPKGKGQAGVVDPKEVRLPLHAAMDCLKFLRDMAKGHVEERISPAGFLNLLARIIPRESGSRTADDCSLFL
jgi:hypothetical protein